MSGEDSKLIPFSEVAKHNTASDCWVIINGKIYDLTSFAPEHPGGEGLVYEVAGTDCTEEFEHAHPEDIMTLTLGPKGLRESFRGMVDPATMPKAGEKKVKKPKPAVPDMDYSSVPPLKAVLNCHDFEHISKRVLYQKGQKQAYDYYSSGADDELTYQENIHSFQRIWLKPRILVNVKEVSMERTICGSNSSFPVYLSAVAMCGLGHPDGELAWMEAAARENVTFMIPNLSSKKFTDILAKRVPNQPTWLQIYVNPNKDVVLDQIRACEAAGVEALAITVDSAVPGKRERDRRNKLAIEIGAAALQEQASPNTAKRKPGSYANRDPALSWDDIKWFQSKTKLPLIIKGVQTGADAVMAAQFGCKAIVLSNHGGRNLDTSRSGIEVLPEVVEALREANLFGKIEIYVDGGIRRGTDILKAIAMGANAVGVGKPAIYSMSAYGTDGIQRMLQILKEELKQAMQLVGCPKLDDLRPSYVDFRSLDGHSHSSAIAENPWSARSQGMRDRDWVKAEIAKLQERLGELNDMDAAGGSSAVRRGSSAVLTPVREQGEPGLASAVVPALGGMAKSIAKTIFSPKVPIALHRSAIFLVLYLIMHLFGNLSVFVVGSSGWNQNIDDMCHSLPYKLFEYYLAAAFIIHGLIGCYNSFNKRRMITKSPMGNGRLAISGAVLTGFLVLHLYSLRFSSSEGFMTSGEKPIHDYHKQATEHLADPMVLAVYLAGIFAVGVHLWVGWAKTIGKFDLAKPLRKPVAALGQFCTVGMCAGFASVALYFFAQSQKAGIGHSEL